MSIVLAYCPTSIVTSTHNNAHDTSAAAAEEERIRAQFHLCMRPRVHVSHDKSYGGGGKGFGVREGGRSLCCVSFYIVEIINSSSSYW